MAISGLQSGGERRKRPKKFLCGLSEINCSGSFVNLPFGSRKCHSSPKEALKCYGRYLISQGYTQLSSRTFTKNDESPVLVLPRESKFGTMLRGGKGKNYVFKKGVAGGIV